MSVYNASKLPLLPPGSAERYARDIKDYSPEIIEEVKHSAETLLQTLYLSSHILKNDHNLMLRAS